MRVFPCKIRKLFIWCSCCVKQRKEKLWSFNFLSKLMRASNCERFFSESGTVHEGCLPHDKNDSDITAHNLQLISATL